MLPNRHDVPFTSACSMFDSNVLLRTLSFKIHRGLILHFFFYNLSGLGPYHLVMDIRPGEVIRNLPKTFLEDNWKDVLLQSPKF